MFMVEILGNFGLACGHVPATSSLVARNAILWSVKNLLDPHFGVSANGPIACSAQSLQVFAMPGWEIRGIHTCLHGAFVKTRVAHRCPITIIQLLLTVCTCILRLASCFA